MTALSGATALVTGGAGFIGSQLVTALLDGTDVARVRVLDSFASGTLDNLAHLHPHLESARLQVVEGDVVSDSNDAVDGIDVVFHLACLGVRHSLHDPVSNHRVNAEGTLRLLQAALHRDVARFIHVSSSEVYGTARYAPMDETHPTFPETVYGGGKLAGEAYARAHWRTYGMPVVIARPFNTYGPRSHFEGDSGEVIPRSIVRALCGLPPLVFGDGEQSRDFTHVRDTAAGLVALAECDAAIGETVNLGSGSEVSINQLTTMVADVVGLEGPTASYQDARPGDVRRLVVNDALMRSLTGWRPSVDFAHGVEDLVGWFRTREQSPEQMLARIEDRNWVPA